MGENPEKFARTAGQLCIRRKFCYESRTNLEARAVKLLVRTTGLDTPLQKAGILHAKISPFMAPENRRERMIELCMRIDRETDPGLLALLISDLMKEIQQKIDEVKSAKSV